MGPFIFHLLSSQEPVKKRRTFRKFTYRGVDLDQLLDMPTEALMELFHARARRRCVRLCVWWIFEAHTWYTL